MYYPHIQTVDLNLRIIKIKYIYLNVIYKYIYTVKPR